MPANDAAVRPLAARHPAPPFFEFPLMAQQDLFGEDAIGSAARRLSVTASAGRVLTKTQKAFNRLIQRVEALRAAIKTTPARLEEALRAHERDVRPRLDALAGLRKDLARTLAQFFTDSRLKRASDRDLLRALVAELIDDAAAHEGAIVDDDLRALWDELNRSSDDASEAGEFNSLRDTVASMLDAMGVKVDLSDLGPDATAEDLHARVGQAMHEARERGEEPRRAAAAPRRQTRKQLEREDRQRQLEEARKRTIGTIYKQLAKALHPDLEPDPERRREKLALMQELTAAHRANDLHTLLRLELAWLHKEEGDLDRLTEEKLAIYNTVLREQVDELEQEHVAIRHHPRFQPLVVEDNLFGFRLELDSSARAAQLDPIIVSMRGDLERLRGPGAMVEVRDLLKAVRERHRHAPRVPF